MKKWTTRSGKEVDVRHMTDRHLANSIAKVKREAWRLSWLPILKAERRRRETAGPTKTETLMRSLGEIEDALWRPPARIQSSPPESPAS